MTKSEIKESVKNNLKLMNSAESIDDIERLGLSLKNDFESLFSQYSYDKILVENIERDMNIVTTYLKSKINSEECYYNQTDFQLSLLQILNIFEFQN